MKKTLFLALALSATFVQSEIIHLEGIKDDQTEEKALQKRPKLDEIISNDNSGKINHEKITEVKENDQNDLQVTEKPAERKAIPNEQNKELQKAHEKSQNKKDTIDVKNPEIVDSQAQQTAALINSNPQEQTIHQEANSLIEAAVDSSDKSNSEIRQESSENPEHSASSKDSTSIELQSESSNKLKDESVAEPKTEADQVLKDLPAKVQNADSQENSSSKSDAQGVGAQNEGPANTQIVQGKQAKNLGSENENVDKTEAEGSDSKVDNIQVDNQIEVVNPPVADEPKIQLVEAINLRVEGQVQPSENS